jgi:hypothetical protein
MAVFDEEYLNSLSKESLIDLCINEKKHNNNLSEKMGELKINYKKVYNKVKENETLLIEEKNNQKELVEIVKNMFPLMIKAIKIINNDNTNNTVKKEFKGYSLSKIPNKKYGFLYYVRYTDNGKLIPSKWNTHTNNLEEANLFAEENRERLVLSYYQNNVYGGIYKILEEYYKKSSKYMKINEEKGKVICEKTRSIYYNFTRKVFIPYLKENNINEFDQITNELIIKFQFFLIEKEIKPGTIVKYLGGINKIFQYLYNEKIIAKNVFNDVIKFKQIYRKD